VQKHGHCSNYVQSTTVQILLSTPVCTSAPFIWSLGSSDNAFNLKIPCCGESMGEDYFLLFKPLPIGHHTITVEVIRVPLQANQPVEHDLAKWDINVV
jgi:hypothetical protein